jgi:agmatine deiminase
MWPTRPDNWRCNGYFGQRDMLNLASLIARFEPVKLAVPSEAIAAVNGQIAPNVQLVPMDFDDIWVRDTGPTVMVAPDSPSIALDWRFNSWGGLFADAAADDAVAGKIASYEHLATLQAPIVLEGGAILSDGQGTLILTEESILAANRNPGLTRAEANKIFSEYFNIQNVIWVPAGLADDEAGGHIDNICAFASSELLLVSSTTDRSHPSFERLEVALDILKQAQSASGKHFIIQQIPLPPATRITETEAAGFDTPKGTISRKCGDPLAPSHTNFYIANGAVLVPTFDCETDATAVSIVSNAFPNRQVIPCPSREFLLGGGAIHCLTKEIPAPQQRRPE